MIKKCRNIIFSSVLMLLLTGCGKIVPNVENAPSDVKITVTYAEITTTEISTTTSESKTTATSAETTAETTTSQAVSSTAAVASAQSTAAVASAAATTEATTTVSSSETVTETTTAQTTESTESGENSDWQSRLVNKTHSIGEYRPPELTTLSNGTQVDSRIYPDLQEMFDDMYAAGYAPYVRAGYRTYEDQQLIMDTRINQHLSEGYSYDGAVAQAERYVAVPGTSEHQLGLAVDINASDGNEWGLYWWLSTYAYQYGFIQRYPQGGEYSTGYDYEPWHYRYVGKEAALYIYQNGLTLEEYLGDY